MIAVWLKMLHVAGITLWAAGLVVLPFLYIQRKRLVEHDLYRLHGFTRFFYVALLSPAAFVAIGSGTVLIFWQQTFAPWFSVKLLLVGLLMTIHIVSGLIILRLFEPEGKYRPWRMWTTLGLTLGVVSAILVLVLGKPDLGRDHGWEAFFAPGALGEMAQPIIAWMR